MIMKYKPCKILMIQEKQGKEKKKQIIGHRVPFMDICEGGDDDWRPMKSRTGKK